GKRSTASGDGATSLRMLTAPASLYFGQSRTNSSWPSLLRNQLMKTLAASRCGGFFGTDTPQDKAMPNFSTGLALAQPPSALQRYTMMLSSPIDSAWPPRVMSVSSNCWLV